MVRLSLIALLLGACTTEDTIPAPTWRDAAREVAYGECSRWIECGTETEQTWQQCVDDLVYTFCDDIYDRTQGRIRCGDTYDGNFDEVSRCSTWYAQVTCGQYVPQCAL